MERLEREKESVEQELEAARREGEERLKKEKEEQKRREKEEVERKQEDEEKRKGEQQRLEEEKGALADTLSQTGIASSLGSAISTWNAGS
eukprot:3932738-Rhodomonas_salina.1